MISERKLIVDWVRIVAALGIVVVHAMSAEYWKLDLIVYPLWLMILTSWWWGDSFMVWNYWFWLGSLYLVTVISSLASVALIKRFRWLSGLV